MRIIAFIFFALLPAFSFSQNKEIDSLKQLIPTLKEDTSKVIALNELATAYYSFDAIKTLDYATRALLLSEQLRYDKGIMKSYKMIGIGYWIKSDMELALDNYNKSLKIALEIEDMKEVASLYNNLAVVHTDQGEYYIALQYFFEGLNVMNENPEDRLYRIFNQNIGDTYKNLGDYENAIKYTQLALKESIKHDDKRGIAVCNNNLGEISTLKGVNKEALARFKNARTIFQDLGNKRGVSITTSNIGDIYLKEGRLEEARTELVLALELFKEFGNHQGEIHTLIQLGDLSLKTQNYSKAIDQLQEGYELSNKAGLLDEKKIALNLIAKYYREQGKFKQALEYSDMHQQLKDSLFNIDKNRQVVELQTLYESEKKERENILLREEQIKKDELLKKNATQQRLLIAFLVAATLFVIILVYLILQSRKVNRKLKSLNNVIVERNEEIQAQSEELNEAYEEIKSINSNLEQTVLNRTELLTKSNAELSEFLYRASHDLKGPLMTLQGLAYLGRRDGEKKFEEIIDRVNKTADEMSSTLNNLLHVNVVRKGSLLNQKINFQELIQKILEPRSKLITEKGIKVNTDISIEENFVSDPDLLSIILENLIDNGVQYCDFNKSDKKVEVKVLPQKESILVHVCDNGVGIADDQLEKIFEMFYRGNIRSHGNGLGLYIVKVAVENLKGKIEINSELGEGTDVKMVFPKATNN